MTTARKLPKPARPAPSRPANDIAEEPLSPELERFAIAIARVVAEDLKRRPPAPKRGE
jgi:hypothetical protein